MEEEMISIYVLPTEPMRPARAILYKVPPGQQEPTMGPPEGEFEGALVTWSTDVGTWVTEESVPVPEPMAEAITEHAKSLGVEAFLD